MQLSVFYAICMGMELIHSRIFIFAVLQPYPPQRRSSLKHTFLKKEALRVSRVSACLEFFSPFLFGQFDLNQTIKKGRLVYLQISSFWPIVLPPMVHSCCLGDRTGGWGEVDSPSLYGTPSFTNMLIPLPRNSSLGMCHAVHSCKSFVRDARLWLQVSGTLLSQRSMKLDTTIKFSTSS